MKKFYLTTTIAVSLLIFNNGVQAQTTQLNQVDLFNQFIGTWQTNVGKDTVELWETQQYGKAFVINVYRSIKGQKNPLYINSIGFDSKEGKFKGFIIWQGGAYSTWIGLFTAENKFSVDMVRNLNPETAYMKREHVFTNPNEWTLTHYGVKTLEYKFKKVK
jgi:hypothetical protein